MDLRPFIEAVERQGLRVEGVAVRQGGRPAAAHRWVPDVPHTVYSVSKSFTSIAVGMAIDEGKLRLGDRLCAAFPRPAPDARWDALTLEHLLTMTLGHGEFTRPQSIAEALSYELVREPGSFFLYDNTCTFLASAMLTRASGCKLRDYLLDRLFRPLGIPDPVWAESADGYTIGATGLELSTESLALFGQFLLDRGRWEGRQLVSAAWIDGATRTQVPTAPSQDKNDYNLGYGYQFWTCRHGAYRCDGKDGQFVVVFPALDAVAAISSAEENMKPILWTVWDYLLPALAP
jgi:CubicO group peptidase (beta-lactamase class C family)